MAPSKRDPNVSCLNSVASELNVPVLLIAVQIEEVERDSAFRQEPSLKNALGRLVRPRPNRRFLGALLSREPHVHPAFSDIAERKCRIAKLCINGENHA
jgi:hypothetical protein